MGHNDVETVQLDLGHLRQPAAYILPIGIAVHGGNRSHGLQLGEQIKRAQVAGMNDVIHRRECAKYFGTQQTVGIGDDSEPH
jgi:hypothetical protein